MPNQEEPSRRPGTPPPDAAHQVTSCGLELSELIRSGELFVDPSDPDYQLNPFKTSGTHTPLPQLGLTNWFESRFGSRRGFSGPHPDVPLHNSARNLTPKIYAAICDYLAEMDKTFSLFNRKMFQDMNILPLSFRYRGKDSADVRHSLEQHEVTILCEGKLQDGRYFSPFQDMFRQSRVMLSSSQNPLLFMVGATRGDVDLEFHPLFSAEALKEKCREMCQYGFGEDYGHNNPLGNQVFDELLQVAVRFRGPFPDLTSWRNEVITLSSGAQVTSRLIDNGDVQNILLTLNTHDDEQQFYAVSLDELSGAVNVSLVTDPNTYL